KQSPPQCVELAFFQLPQPSLQQHAQVVGGNRQMMHGLGAPEIVHAQPFDAKLPAQFFDAVFEVGPTVVLSPDAGGVHTAGQIGNQGLKAIAGNVQQCLAAGSGTLLDPLTNHNQTPARLVQ